MTSDNYSEIEGQIIQNKGILENLDDLPNFVKS